VAIGYIEARIVSAGRGESVVGLGYYVCRRDGANPIDGRTFRYAKNGADLASLDVLLPPGAPLAYQDPAQLCAAMEARETTIDRKTGLPRFKVNAQVARHIVLALPKELNLAEQRRLACDWAGTQYVKHGVGAIVAVHHPDDPETGNAHAHIIVSTRLVTAAGLGKKARHLNPAFTRARGHTRSTLHAEDLPGQWAAFQDLWFRKHGIELRVDPFQRRGGVHLGRALYVPETDAEAANKAAFEDSHRLIQDPAEALSTLTQRKATFSRREVMGLFRRYKFSKAEIQQLTDRVLAHPDLVRLHDPETGAVLPRFTTRLVREQERRILDAAEALLAAKPDQNRRNLIAAAAQARIAAMKLSPEQAAGLLHLVDGPNLRLLRGIAGAGKSYTIRAVREALEAGGFRVIGLAPTNTVTCAMAVDGFTEASTVDLELIRQEAARFGTEPWDSDTCLIIDEAAMLDAGRYERILVRAAAVGARVILVGDEKQLASVQRGGIFDELKARHGCAELLDVRRQDEPWAKAASRDFAAGRMHEGIEAYASRGHLHWSDGLDEAMAALVARWSADMRRDPAGSRFAYAATNKVVDVLNATLQNERWQGQNITFESFETKRGDSTLRIDLVVGDRIQLHGTNRKRGLYNGIVGTVTFASQQRIQFTTDDGRQLAFDPSAYNTWALGYAGTAYRGQGKTQTQVYALYDHQLAWHARTSYVAFTRHRKSMDLFVPRQLAADLDALVRQMSRADETRASIALLDKAEAGELRRRLAREGAKAAAPVRRAPDSKRVAASPAPAPVNSEIVVQTARPTRSDSPRAHLQEAPADAPLDLPPQSSILPAGDGPTSGDGPGASRRRSGELPAMPFKLQTSDLHSFDLSLPEQRNQLLKALANQPMPQVVDAYARIRQLATSQPKAARDQLHNFLGSITTESRKRAFLPAKNKADRECLRYVRLDPWNIMNDEPLQYRDDEIDVRPIVQPLYHVDPGIRRTFADRMKGFVIETLRAIDDSLGKASLRAIDNEELRYAIINTRLWFYDLTHAWRLDLRPDMTIGLGGQRPTPEQYRDYIASARKAEAAAKPAMEPDAPEAHQPERPIRKRPADCHILHDLDLIRFYRERITDQVRAAEERLSGARMRLPVAGTPHISSIALEEVELAALELERLRRKKHAFEKDEHGTIRSAQAIDFLPASITEQDVAPRRSDKFLYLEAAGYRPPDRAQKMLEDQLLGTLTLPSRAPKTASAPPAPATRRRAMTQREIA